MAGGDRRRRGAGSNRRADRALAGRSPRVAGPGPLPDRSHRRRQAGTPLHGAGARLRAGQTARVPRDQSGRDEGLRDAVRARRERQRIQPRMHPRRARARPRSRRHAAEQFGTTAARAAGRDLCRLVGPGHAAQGICRRSGAQSGCRNQARIGRVGVHRRAGGGSDRSIRRRRDGYAGRLQARREQRHRVVVADRRRRLRFGARPSDAAARGLADRAQRRGTGRGQMTALRAGLLVLSGSIAAAAAAGAWRDAPEPSVQRLVVACAAALVVPLLWPGAAQAAGRTGVRIGGWSGASAAFAVVLLAAAGGGRQAPARLASCGAMMLAVVAATLALAALIELAIRRRGRGNDGNAAAREVAGRAAALALMFVSALPLWLGPAAEWVWRDWPWAIDAVVATRDREE